MSRIHINFDGNNGFGVLDPALCILQGTANILHNTLVGLMQFHGSALLPGVAEHYIAEDENRKFTFILGEWSWSDGRPVTANDFVFAWRRVLQNEESPHRPHFSYIKGVQAYFDGQGDIEAIGIRADGDKCMIVELEKSCPFFLSLTASTPYLPVPQHEAERIGEVGNGMYTVKKMEMNRIVLASSDLSHPEIVATMCGDEHWIDEAFRNGEIDISDGLPHHTVEKYQQANQLHYTPELGTFYLQFNLRSEVFKEHSSRMWIRSCLEIEELVKRSEINEQAACSLIPWNFFVQYEVQILPPQIFNTGMRTEQNAEIELAVNNLEIYVGMAEIVKYQIEKNSSFRVVIKKYEWEQFLEVLQAGTFDIALNGWIADYFDPLSILEVWRTDSEYNFSAYSHEQFDCLLENSKTEMNVTARYKLLQRAESLLLEDLPVVPIYQYRIPMLKQSHVQDVVISPFGVFDFHSIRTVALPDPITMNVRES